MDSMDLSMDCVMDGNLIRPGGSLEISEDIFGLFNELEDFTTNLGAENSVQYFDPASISTQLDLCESSSTSSTDVNALMSLRRKKVAIKCEPEDDMENDPYSPGKPLKTSTTFCIGLSNAFNSGDAFKIADLINNFTSNNLVFRMRDDKSQFHTTGSDKLIKYFHGLLDAFPDGAVFIKSVTPGRMNGYRILTVKFFFTGTRMPNQKQIAAAGGKVYPQYKVASKGTTTGYLDQSNRIVILEDRVKSISRSRPCDRKNLYDKMMNSTTSRMKTVN